MSASPEQIRDVLLKAAELIEPEGAWCQGEFAQNQAGESVGSRSGDACRWCLEGAVIRASVGLDWRTRVAVCEALVAVVPQPKNKDLNALVAFNDTEGRTATEVVAKLREAAARVMEAHS